MPHGVTPQYGIPKPEVGLLIESFNPSCKVSKHEQLDHLGRKCGVMQIDQEVSFSMAGAVPLEGANIQKAGSLLVTANADLVDPLWKTKPTATTPWIDDSSLDYSNNSPTKHSINGVIYAFGDSSSSNT